MGARVLILGGGFGGVAAALELEKVLARRPDLEVTLVTRDNFFLFTPMLHEVAASDLEVSDIVSPLRRLLERVRTFVGSLFFSKDFACVTAGLVPDRDGAGAT